MKTLMILSAIPASGKSTWAAKYQATHPNTYIVSSDQIRMEVTHGDFQDHSKQKEVCAKNHRQKFAGTNPFTHPRIKRLFGEIFRVADQYK